MSGKGRRGKRTSGKKRKISALLSPSLGERDGSLQRNYLAEEGVWGGGREIVSSEQKRERERKTKMTQKLSYRKKRSEKKPRTAIPTVREKEERSFVVRNPLKETCKSRIVQGKSTREADRRGGTTDREMGKTSHLQGTIGGGGVRKLAGVLSEHNFH